MNIKSKDFTLKGLYKLNTDSQSSLLVQTTSILLSKQYLLALIGSYCSNIIDWIEIHGCKTAFEGSPVQLQHKASVPQQTAHVAVFSFSKESQYFEKHWEYFMNCCVLVYHNFTEINSFVQEVDSVYIWDPFKYKLSEMAQQIYLWKKWISNRNMKFWSFQPRSGILQGKSNFLLIPYFSSVNQ